MTQAVSATIDRYAADFRAFQDQGEGSEWLRELREKAFAHFQRIGFPTARHGNEAWKYTNVAPIASQEFSYALTSIREPAVEDLAANAPWCTAWHEVVFVNERYSPSLSASSS